MDARHRKDSIERIEYYHDPRFRLNVEASTDERTILQFGMRLVSAGATTPSRECT